ncbi:hypothetical protein Ancab_035213, partial [Ancistrocladus abbreviatus]
HSPSTHRTKLQSPSLERNLDDILDGWKALSWTRDYLSSVESERLNPGEGEGKD